MRKKARLLSTLALIGMLTACPEGSKANPDAVEASLKAATSWLALVDAGDYDASWQEAASYFKALVPQQQWKQAMTGARAPLGSLISRKQSLQKYSTSLPGAPDGEYVLIEFVTRFENKKSAVETVTPMRDKDGKWRVSGYYIK